ncbi:hypothetical protein EVAR_73277_1 [Eumeta japonica]|uniref:Uncharacterized protein n=1 Tax=Eumeta variegata TaxID=151549 RepID=A0A4C1T156_EUMVA|nr:hypothetical protein EVAR_73277_1 [Eumeta japonica]
MDPIATTIPLARMGTTLPDEDVTPFYGLPSLPAEGALDFLKRKWTLFYLEELMALSVNYHRTLHFWEPRKTSGLTTTSVEVAITRKRRRLLGTSRALESLRKISAGVIFNDMFELSTVSLGVFPLNSVIPNLTYI